MNSAMAQPRREAMAARGGLSHLLDNFEDSRRPSSPSGLGSRFSSKGGRTASETGWAGRPGPLLRLLQAQPHFLSFGFGPFPFSPSLGHPAAHQPAQSASFSLSLTDSWAQGVSPFFLLPPSQQRACLPAGSSPPPGLSLRCDPSPPRACVTSPRTASLPSSPLCAFPPTYPSYKAPFPFASAPRSFLPPHHLDLHCRRRPKFDLLPRRSGFTAHNCINAWDYGLLLGCWPDFSNHIDLMEFVLWFECKLLRPSIHAKLDDSSTDINAGICGALERPHKNERCLGVGLHVEDNEIHRDEEILDFHRNILRDPSWLVSLPPNSGGRQSSRRAL
nr:unnamed protein product [Digitaria exilis]